MTDSDHENGDSFAEGQRTLPHTDDSPGHFSEGQETVHAEHVRMGSFADTSCPDCVAVEAGHAEHIRKGSFADTYCPKCQAMAKP